MVLERKRRPNKRRFVSDEEFSAALKNSDNIHIIGKVCSTFTSVLPEDDIKSISYEALWLTLGYHIPGKGNKFTTSLYFFLKKRLIRAVENKNREENKLSYSEIDFSEITKEDRYDTEELEHVMQNIARLSEDEQEIVKKYYFERLSFVKIAKSMGVTKSRVVTKFNRSMEKLKVFC